MDPVKEQFIVDEKGNKTAVIIDFEEYKKIIEELEELSAEMAYHKGMAEKDTAIRFDEAIREIEKNRK
jgi:PHD/YefM family antitoxin component YafN of YafNO toxin-antitoxin module